MEWAFGADFSDVRIHQGSRAESLNAMAFTQGTDIYFAPGQYDPHAQGGRELLGHELTHVVQQTEGRVRATGQANGAAINDDPSLEQEADALGSRAARGEKVASGDRGKGSPSRSSSELLQARRTSSDSSAASAGEHEQLGLEGVDTTEVVRNPSAEALWSSDGTGGLVQGNRAAHPAQAKDLEQPIQRQLEGEQDRLAVPYRIQITRPLTGDEFKIVAMQQVFGRVIDNVVWENIRDSYSPDDSPVTLNVALGLLNSYRDEMNRARGFDVSEGGGIAGAEDRARSFHSAPASDEVNALMTEIDRRYYQESGVPDGTKIRPGEAGRAELWRTIRDEVLFQHDYIANLPAKVTQVIRLSIRGRTLTPADYDQLFHIAKKIESMPAATVADYVSKINGFTTDLGQLDLALDTYIDTIARRDEQRAERERLQTKLFGLEAVYEKYRTYKTLQTTSAVSAGMGRMPGGFGGYGAGISLGSQPAISSLRHELEEQLQAHGFGSIDEFATYISNFEDAFETEAASIVIDVLAKYQGMLYRESQRYRDPGQLSALRLAIQNEDPTLPDNYPIFSDEDLPQDKRVNKEALLRAGEAGMGALLQGQIANRLQDVQEAQARVEGKNELIFKMDQMMPHFYVQQGIAPESIYDRIIQDKIRDDAIKNLVVGVLLAIIAIALTVVSLGSATPALVAAGAAAGAFGLSAFMAYEEYQKYTEENDLADVGLADDPSMVWLIVAIAGSALDMGAMVKAVRALGPAARAVNAGGDVSEFTRAVRALQEAGEIDARIARAAENAALARYAFTQASGDLTRTLAGRLHSVPGAFMDPEVFQILIRMAKAKIQQGVSSFQVFAAELKRARTLAALDDLAPEELARAKEAWEQALQLARSSEEPIEILSESGRVIGRYSNGSHLEIIARGQPLHGGNLIRLDPNATTTVTGTLDDVNKVARRGAQLPGATSMGANPGGINILRSPQWAAIKAKHMSLLDSGDELRYWQTVTDEFWRTVNKPWLDEALARGDKFRFISNATDESAIYVTRRSGEFVLDEGSNRIKSIFGREVDYLEAHGYVFQADGTAIKPQ